ncbi:MAG TPA: lysozyme [Pseudonocardiaceae bacterium]|jgi:GH25 family lysozyme M1 (1,4-beta-N-acetylmuramidase)|nr:lysozyme [Pseudonocardiaceae bacterium]
MKTLSLISRLVRHTLLALGVLVLGIATPVAASFTSLAVPQSIVPPVVSPIAPPPSAQTLARAPDPPTDDPPASDPSTDHPDLDWAGSRIRAQEGAEPGPRGADIPAAGLLRGLDVSGHQRRIDWARAAAGGARFAYVKATEGTGATNPRFAQQYDGARRAGLIRGAYHFALPNRSAGRAQADFFVAHGGGWSRDGHTLPPMLDMEYNPYGPACYGLGPAAMADWARSFATEVHARTGRWPTIYTSTNWWRLCTGGRADFAGTDPLFLARYASRSGPLPPRWRSWTFWQFSDAGPLPGDQDYFYGGPDRLRALANG